MVRQQVDLERGPFPMGRTQNRPLDASQDPIGPGAEIRRGFFVSPSAKEQSQAMPNANVLPEKTIDSSWELVKL